MATKKQTRAARRNVKKAQSKERDIPGRSKMGKWELIDAIRKSG